MSILTFLLWSAAIIAVVFVGSAVGFGIYKAVTNSK